MKTRKIKTITGHYLNLWRLVEILAETEIENRHKIQRQKDRKTDHTHTHQKSRQAPFQMFNKLQTDKTQHLSPILTKLNVTYTFREKCKQRW